MYFITRYCGLCNKEEVLAKEAIETTASAAALPRTGTDLALFGRTSSQFEQRNPMAHERVMT
jgi:hypothetical protein